MTPLFLYVFGVLAIGLILYFVRSHQSSLWRPTIPPPGVPQKKATHTADASSRTPPGSGEREPSRTRDEMVVVG